MDSNELALNINDSFDSYEKVNKKMKSYTQATKYGFSVKRSKKLTSLANLPANYNSGLIYDEIYYKCQANPKSDTLKKFKTENPKYVKL